MQASTQKSKNPFLRLMRDYVKKYIPMLGLAVVFMLITAAATGVQPIILQLAFDKVFNEKNLTYLTYIPFAIIAVFIVQAIALYGSTYLINKFSNSMNADLRNSLFKRVINYDLEFYSKNNSGNLLARITGEISSSVSGLNAMFSSLQQSLTATTLIAGMLYQSVELTIISLGAFLFAFYPLMRIAKRIKKISRQTNEKNANMSSRLLESFNGIRVVKAFGKEEYEAKKVSGYIDEIRKLTNKANKIGGLTPPLMQTMAGLAVAFVIWYGGHELIKGTMTEGSLIAFITSLILVSRPIRGIANSGNGIINAFVATTRFYEVLDQVPIAANNKSGNILDIKKGEIKFENLTFSYPDGTTALRGINLVIEAGKRTALVGHSGSGKSTIFNLLLRFYKASAGDILIDGQSISNANTEYLRKNISLVSQDIFIFDDTARNNIGYGRDNATDDEIIAAAKAAHCHDFISSLPDGYDTNLGFFGEKLSGGQKQRIAIARAFLRNSPILLLDEATSALDPKTESEIQGAIAQLSKDRTTIIIAHRLSTVINSDKMVMLAGGTVKAQGTHADLLALPEYKKLFDL